MLQYPLYSNTNLTSVVLRLYRRWSSMLLYRRCEWFWVWNRWCRKNMRLIIHTKNLWCTRMLLYVLCMYMYYVCMWSWTKVGVMELKFNQVLTIRKTKKQTTPNLNRLFSGLQFSSITITPTFVPLASCTVQYTYTCTVLYSTVVRSTVVHVQYLQYM